MTSHAYQLMEAGRAATPWRILPVSTDTFWRLISHAYRSARIDHHALIGRSGCINGYNIRNADIRKTNVVLMYHSTFELQYACTIVILYYSTFELQYACTTVRLYYGTFVLWYICTMVHLYYSTLVLWYICTRLRTG